MAMTAHPKAVITGERYRITVLTPYLIRMEYSDKGAFVDAPTQMVTNRRFELPEYRLTETDEELKIVTEGLRLTYDKQKFSPEGLKIELSGNYACYSAVWHYGDEPRDLKGTARTLDNADGAIPLEHGILSAEGWSVLNDKGSLLLDETGWIQLRQDPEADDLYFFGYGRAYLACLKDYHHLTGQVPLLPRYALGNWWSRYYRYTQKSYLELMDRFREEDIPFTVSVIDMDWHLTEIDPKYGTGWTGYTWNRALFPDPRDFMDQLHQRGLKVTLNVHPADGVRAFEDCYPAFAEYMGVDAGHEDPVPFQPGSRKFMEGYFQYVHHPLEEQGVDFWWIDWQQGNNSGVKGLDPLWMLNHYHYLDSQRDGKRGMVFSRYAGPGSHRYPIGFSGDSIISWASLDFQPYFTVNASNIGYGWWSHDIGGHMMGIKDDELAVRWLQFGVFSPIMRLHSSSSEFNGKEPWRYNKIAESVMKRYLRLRHRMIPYLNTMNYRAAMESVPLMQPMYYHHPMDREAYTVPNQYYFGSELIVCPMTHKCDSQSGTAQFTAWLPQGRWTDLFTGLIYTGGRKMVLNRSVEEMPVLLREGGILPLDGRTTGNALDNPEKLEVHVFMGKPGNFVLREDEGDGFGEWCETPYSLCYDKNVTFTIGEPSGNRAVLPANRSYRLVFRGVGAGIKTVIRCGEEAVAPLSACYDAHLQAAVLELPALPTDQRLTVEVEDLCEPDNAPVERVFDYLNRAEISFISKERIYAAVKKLHQGQSVLMVEAELQAMDLDPAILRPVHEILLANG